MAGDVHGFYGALGVSLPTRPGAANVTVRCFADPAAHKRDDKKPACSVNTENGLWKCFACGATGNPYQAATALGKTSAEAMELLERYGLREPDARPRKRARRQPTPVHQASVQERPAVPASQPRAATEEQRGHYQDALLGNADRVAWLRQLRGWTHDAIVDLGLGFDGDRVVFPIRDAAGALVGFLRYAPDPDARGDAPKMLADTGSARELFPAPESVEEGDDLLWIFEGEPDAVAGLSLGLSCVSIPGVEGWRPEWAERFRGRRIAVCFDVDPAGRAAARRVAADLTGIAAEVRVVDLEELCARAASPTDPANGVAHA